MGLFSLQGKLASNHPKIAIGLVLALTVVFGYGMTLSGGGGGDQADSFLPPESELAQAQARVSEDFGGSTATVPVQVIVRADDVLAPAALREAIQLTNLAADEAGDFLVGEPFGYAQAVSLLMGGSIPAEATREDVADAIAATEGNPTLAGIGASIQQLVSGDGSAGMIILNIDGDLDVHSEKELMDVQLAIETAVVEANQDETNTRTFSAAKLNDEMAAAQGTSTTILMMAAMLIIVLVLVVFYRTGGDVLLSIGGLIMTIIWVFGMQGFLGPKGLGVIGADNPLAMMIPVLLIGLTVDYALQITGRYREDIALGKTAKESSYEAAKHSALPLLLASGTTMVAFFTNITSSLPPMKDFGIIAGLGVMFGWFVMMTLVPAARGLMDQKRERKGKKLQSRSMAEAIPGVGKLLGRLANGIVRHPTVVLGVVAVVSIASFVGAANVSTTFSQTDFLPSNTESFEDLELLSAEFGGGGTTAQVLVEGDFLNPIEVVQLALFEFAINDEETRPEGATGPIRNSLFTLITDFAQDTGLPGDRYDADFEALITDMAALGADGITRSDMQGLYDTLADVAGPEFDAVMALHQDDQSRSDRVLLTIPMVSGDAAATSAFQKDIRALWEEQGGNPDNLFLTGSEILTVAVTDEMTNSQLESVILTIVAALIVLTIFFGISEKKPILGVITVLPIGLVVGWVLGSMYLLGISYNVMTALITALTIGVGVDYTIHVTHRFLEELEEKKGIRHALSESMRTTGGALIGSALTTALGFGVLIFSPLAPMQQFGGLTALTILYSLIAAFIVLPPMLVLWALFQSWRTGEATTEARPQVRQVGQAPLVMGARTDVPGSTLTCPKCRTRTFVPEQVPGLRCPNLHCTFSGQKGQ